MPSSTGIGSNYCSIDLHQHILFKTEICLYLFLLIRFKFVNLQNRENNEGQSNDFSKIVLLISRGLKEILLFLCDILCTDSSCRSFIKTTV